MSFRGYLGEIESENKNTLDFLHTSFSHVQCCVRVGAPNFHVPTRKDGGARAFGNYVRFLTGPDRTSIDVSKKSADSQNVRIEPAAFNI